MSGMKILRPECRYGYTVPQIEEIMGPRLREFQGYMIGQTMTICDGLSYDHEKKDYVESGCGPHGTAVYPWDVERFLQGFPVID